MKYYFFKTRIYYEDTDAGGVVYYANYLKFAERVRTELLRSGGFGNKSLLDHEGIAFVVRHITADYLKPARLDDLLEVRTIIDQIRSASVIMDQSMYRDDILLFNMRVKLVCVSLNSMKPVPMPDNVQDAFKPYLKVTD